MYKYVCMYVYRTSIFRASRVLATPQQKYTKLAKHARETAVIGKFALQNFKFN